MRGPVFGRPRHLLLGVQILSQLRRFESQFPDDPCDDEDAYRYDRPGRAAAHADGINDVVLKLVLAFEIVLHQLGGGTCVQSFPGCRDRVRGRFRLMTNKIRVKVAVVYMTR